MGVMTAREFYLNKSNVLSRAAAGETIQITRHGRPIARVVPAIDDLGQTRPERGTPEWQAAYDKMMTTMEKGFPLGIGRLTYKDKHE